MVDFSKLEKFTQEQVDEMAEKYQSITLKLEIDKLKQQEKETIDRMVRELNTLRDSFNPQINDIQEQIRLKESEYIKLTNG